MTGSTETTLTVPRGNSASGKSSVAEEIRQRHCRGMAIVGQDHLRRNLPWEKDRPGAAHVRPDLRQLGDAFCSFDVSFEEILRRHLTKPQAVEYGEREMREWYRPLDLLPLVTEHRIPEATTLDEAVNMVMRIARLRARE